MLLKRISTLFSRRRRAKQLGFAFDRVRGFEIPNSIHIFGKDVAIHVPPQSTMQGCFLEVLMDDSYGLRKLRNKNIKTVLDIGANVGFFGLAAREAFPDATIHQYEPNPAVMPYLKEHAAASGATVYGEAVGREAGRVRLDDADFVNVRSVVDSDGTIPQTAFRTAIERVGGKVDLVKLDCEGAEWSMLADKEAWRNVKHLTMEYHLWDTKYRHEGMHNVLADIGFAIRHQMLMRDVVGIVWASRAR